MSSGGFNKKNKKWKKLQENNHPTSMTI